MRHRLALISYAGFLILPMTACVHQATHATSPQQAAPVAIPLSSVMASFSEDVALSSYNQPDLSNARCDLQSAQEFQEQAIRMLNVLREKEQVCGAEVMPVTQAIKWNVRLQTAAFEHSAQMATTNIVSHTSVDARQLRDRVNAVGYRYAVLGENITAGPANLTAAIHAWLSSPRHCKHMLSAEFTEFAVACVAKKNSFYQKYWTMNLGRPRPEPTIVSSPEVKK